MTIAADDPLIRWMGRTHRPGDGSVRIGFPGIVLSIRTDAVRVEVQVTAASPDCWFDLSVDGGPATVLRPAAGTSDLLLAEGLAPGAHRLDLTRRTESWIGCATVHGVRITGGGLLPADPPPLRRLLFIGDSITCGAAVGCLPPDFPTGHIASDAAGSFGMELGRRLAADVHLVSYGGRGVLRDYRGFHDDRTDNAPVFFERALPDDPAIPWDHAAYQPDGIVVGLGTNDLALGVPDTAAWIDAYERFTKRLREVHPRARILLTTSPMIGPAGGEADAVKAEALVSLLQATVRRRMDAGDRSIGWTQLPRVPGERNSHPDARGHQRVADALEPELHGWFDAARRGGDLG